MLPLSLLLLSAPAQPAKVVIIGLDGVSLNLLEPYAEAGVTPNLKKLMEQGARGHLEAFWPTRTPQVWTSAVTGKLPGQHGIWDHLSNTWYSPPDVRTKNKRVVTVRDRKSKALWNLLDAKGLKSLVVGWVVTHPAEKLEHGAIVAPVELMGDRRQTTIKGSFYRGARQGTVQPESLWPEVSELIVDPSDITAAELKPYADVPPPTSALYKLPRLKGYMYTYKWSLARARTVEKITLGLLDDVKPDVVFSYFQCTDTMGHRFWSFKEPEEYTSQRLGELGLPAKYAAELKERFGGAFEACYRDSDERLGRILEATAGPDTLVVILSDHGFGHGERPHPFKSEPYGGVHLDQGIIIAVGPGIPGGTTIEGASVLDITPTVLHYLGQPVADDMCGKVIDNLFDYDRVRLSKRPVERIPTYEAKAQTVCPYPDGYPPRSIPLRPTSEQMNGRNPYEKN
ncbi:MAG: alkaline phosphatase family protein [Myxococcota bacterium]